jgi:hypothetical protein
MSCKNNSLFNKWCWGNWISIYRRLKLDPRISPCTNINSKWVKDLNVRFKMVKLIQERIENTTDHLGIVNHFMNSTPTVKQLREKIDKWDSMKLKGLCTAKANSH